MGSKEHSAFSRSCIDTTSLTTHTKQYLFLCNFCLICIGMNYHMWQAKHSHMLNDFFLMSFADMMVISEVKDVFCVQQLGAGETEMSCYDK